jgi:hypothetical protein
MRVTVLTRSYIKSVLDILLKQPEREAGDTRRSKNVRTLETELGRDWELRHEDEHRVMKKTYRFLTKVLNCHNSRRCPSPCLLFGTRRFGG